MNGIYELRSETLLRIASFTETLCNQSRQNSITFVNLLSTPATASLFQIVEGALKAQSEITIRRRTKEPKPVSEAYVASQSKLLGQIAAEIHMLKPTLSFGVRSGKLSLFSPIAGFDISTRLNHDFHCGIVIESFPWNPPLRTIARNSKKLGDLFHGRGSLSTPLFSGRTRNNH